MNLKIALGQFDTILGRPDQNMATVESMLTEAAKNKTDLVLFPELWYSGYDLAKAERYATDIDNGVFLETAELAKEYGLSIVGSCLSTLDNGQYGNTAVFLNKNGSCLGAYTKIHLFRLMEEDRYLASGKHLTIVDTQWGRIGLAICYDLRFPEIFRAYALAGVRIVLLPSQWPYPRLAHWRTLLRARAIENQFFVAACNRIGSKDDTMFCGHSAIVDPWGEIIVEGDDSFDLLTGTVDLARVDEVRAKIPILLDRQPAIYTSKIQGI